MSVTNIPEVINCFNVYNGGNKLIGLSGEISLPDFQSLTETISGSGILGEFETTVAGMFSSMEMEIPFRILDDDIFSFMDPTKSVNLTLRASEQYTVKSTAAVDYKGLRVVIRGRKKNFKPGTVKNGAQMGASITTEILYILIELNGKKMIELDKLNGVYIVNGVDLLRKVRKYC